MGFAQYKMTSPVGNLYLVASPQGLRGVYRSKQPLGLASKLYSLRPEDEIARKARAQLREYFKGQRTHFDLALDFQGTAFQKKVWQELSKIPFGQTASYKDIAERIRHPKAVRAVGSANSRNPVCIIIPCHRVIASDGSLGGYSAGLAMKRKLLKLERR